MEFLSKNKTNSFNSQNHLCCFNHTLQLSAKALLHPFSVKMEDDEPENDNEDDDFPEPEDLDNLSHLNGNIDDDDGDEDEDPLDIGGEDGEEEAEDDGVDELEKLTLSSCSALLHDTKEVCHALSKV